ncbi:MAG: Ubiquinone/menaquinone biosynthesis C-methyltransferase UbiE [Gemmatimonadaceae bacterium]|nr:Ubiquinone/menaquinone biosynthesis C-methyltransferase UbiE [Gemmatimonadaceae bacterium]
MTQGEGRERWADRYAQAGAEDKAGSTWLLEAAMSLPPDATIVDLAGGLGRHARPLAAQGRRVVVVDFVESALRVARDRAPRVEVVTADIWQLPFGRDSLDAILVANFLERDFFPTLKGLLRPGGFLLYETYTVAHAALVTAGEARAPRSPRYMLEEGELLRLVSPLEVLASREGTVDDAAGRRACASVLARRAEASDAGTPRARMG